jgi:hypothetical protein
VSYGYPPQDPYNQYPKYDPYQQGYGPYGGYGPPQRPAGNGAAIGALVCNILLIFLCLPLSIPGVILSALALGKTNHEPHTARKLTMWAWICFGTGLVVAVLFLAWFLNQAESDDPGFYQSA